MQIFYQSTSPLFSMSVKAYAPHSRRDMAKQLFARLRKMRTSSPKIRSQQLHCSCPRVQASADHKLCVKERLIKRAKHLRVAFSK